jgi:hypothetical protein
MDFWDSLTESEKAICKECVDQIKAEEKRA